MLTLDQIAERIREKKVIYVGEYHDRPGHHSTQLALIRKLFEHDPRLAIGMEMFQRPFQNVVDLYIGQEITEREFLARSEYFQRWGFDYHLYKPILDFAREKRIPVLALNAPGPVVSKIGRQGLEALSPEERAQIAGQLDFSDATYTHRLKRVFEGHGGMAGRRFESFLQAQTAWDETMAQTIAEFGAHHPERPVIVLAGKEHIAYRSGIPSRAFRRHPAPFATILLDADPEPDIADYILFPPEEKGTTSPTMMVGLNDHDGTVRISHIPEDSVSASAGLRPDDVILSIDGAPVRSGADVRLALFYHEHGDVVAVTVRRTGLFAHQNELTLRVTLR